MPGTVEERSEREVGEMRPTCPLFASQNRNGVKTQPYLVESVRLYVWNSTRRRTQCLPISQSTTIYWKRPRRWADTGRSGKPSQLRYRSTSNIASNKKSFLCLGELITSLATTTSANARPSVYECLDRHIGLVPSTSSKERESQHKRKIPSGRGV